MDWGSVPDAMEQPELEEGEACYYKDDTSIDPDIALSYIDERLQNVLGHLQKDFEGGVSAENLGAKFGGYGSFLPTYQRSSSIWSHPRTPQQGLNHGAPRSPNYMPQEGVNQNPVAFGDASRRKTTAASHSMHSSHNLMFPSGDDSVRQDSHVSSTQAAETLPEKHETPLSKPVILTDQRTTLKVRIKVGPDKTAQKNAAIYSGLGLISPSSSTGHSPSVSGGMSSEFQETPKESPASIIQIMTSFPVVGGLLLTPLHDNLLNLTNEKICVDYKPLGVNKDSHNHSAKFVDKSTSKVGDRDVLKEKGKKVVAKSELLAEPKHGKGNDLVNETFSITKHFPNDVRVESRQSFSNDLNAKSFTDSQCNTGESLKAAVEVHEAMRESEKDIPVKKRDLNKNKLRDKSLSSDLFKNESFESMPEQTNSDPWESKSQRTAEHPVKSSKKDTLVDQKLGNRTSASYRGDNDISKGERDAKGTADNLQERVGSKVTSNECYGTQKPVTAKKIRIEGKKKSKGSHSNGKSSSNLAAEDLKASGSAFLKDNKSSKKDVRNTLDMRLENVQRQKNLLEKHFGDRLKESKMEAVKEKHFYVDKPKERLNSKKIDNQTASGMLLKDPAETHLLSEGLRLETEQASAAVIEESWVCCDRCQKWRLLPQGTKAEELPEKWLCSMLSWLPGMNNCDVSEDETTKALHSLYIPITENQNNIQNHLDRGTFTAASADVYHINKQNHQNFNSDYVANKGKKRQKLKEKHQSSTDGVPRVANLKKKPQQEMTLKSKSLKEVNQLVGEANSFDKYDTQLASKSYKSLSKRKEEPLIEGDVKLKKRNKRDSDQHGHVAIKKIKIEGTMNNLRTTAEDVGKSNIGVSSLQSREAPKDSQICTEHGYVKGEMSETGNGLLVSVKEHKNRLQDSLAGGSVDMKVGNKNGISIKKRKLEDYEDYEDGDYAEILQNNRSQHRESNVYGKVESNDSGFRGEKKFRMSQYSTSKGDDMPKVKDTVNRILLSGGRDEPVNSSSVKERPKKYRAKVTSQLTAADIESLKRDLGSEQLSTAATSSSSKVSDSRKTRTSYREMKGSPVESVSSSPMRTSNLNKLSPAKDDSLGKDEGRFCNFPIMENPRKYVNLDSNVESSRFGTSWKGKASSIFHPESFENSMLDFHGSVVREKFDGKAESSVEHFSELRNGHLVNKNADILEQTCDMHASSSRSTKVSTIRSRSITVSLKQKSGGNSSLHSKDKERIHVSNLERIVEKASDKPSEPEALNQKKSLKEGVDNDRRRLASSCENLENRGFLFSDESSIKSVRNFKGGKKDPEKVVGGRRDNQLKLGEHDKSGRKLGALCSTDESIRRQYSAVQDFETETAKNIIPSDAMSTLRKSQVESHYEDRQDKIPLSFASKLDSGPRKGSFSGVHVADAPFRGDASKLPNDPGALHQNGTHNSIGPALDQCVVQDLSVPNLMRRESSSQTASSALKEAGDLRDCADRIKNSGFGFECNEAYFQAGLKFLHGATLLETCPGDSNKHGEVNQMQVYSTAAKLCETCAIEYEKRQEMAAAALAYKCMEVAYMRVVLCKTLSTNRVWHDLQTSLQMAPQGESPSSSASDVDNLNNQALVDKTALSKGSGSHTGNHVIGHRNRPNVIRLLDFTMDVNSAMEASRKSQNAFAAAKLILKDTQNKEVIIAVKKVIDFSFQDVEELVRLVRLATEAISNRGLSGSRN